ncbi:hypothetical protein M405DRAFT_753439 [Rhizopogon salebrosus TDB-379]|nr:hypothetical protein M405DRAFT_753439 [Rhizopogon salebrosus TDB-379]
MPPTQDVRKKYRRFRILIVGRANAGKTTLLQKVCNTTEKPEIFDERSSQILDSFQRGYHDINNELMFRGNPRFVFHDSCVFEAGDEDEFEKMKQFVSDRASARKLNDRIHAIWQAIISMRLYLIVIFSLTGIASRWMIPVIAVFTKFDALSSVALGQLRKIPGLTRKDIFEGTPERVEQIFSNALILDRLCKTQHPPKDYVRLAKMNIDQTDCGPLLECTGVALGDEALQKLLISTQQTDLELCIMYDFLSLLTL